MLDHDDTKPSAAEILSWDAITLSESIREKRITCHDLMLATLDRIDAVNPHCNAIILLQDRDILLGQAKEKDDELLKHPNGCRGWLHGIPIAIKDLSNAKGFPTTKGGSRLFSENVPAGENDAHVEKLVKAGAIVIGKTNTPEGGLGSNTFNDRFGATRNPFDLSKTSGGSSGGAAVALSTRMLAVADGSDNLGSLRNPAGWNNIYSIRPTAGLIPGGQTVSAADKVMGHPDATVGPIATTPKDVSMLLQTMVGDDNAIDCSASIVEEKHHTPQTHVRIGWLGDWGGYLPFEDGILSQCRYALDTWTKSHTGECKITVSHVQDTLSLFPFEQLWDAYNTVRFTATLEKYADEFDVDDLIEKRGTLIKEELAWEIEQGRLVTDRVLMRARNTHRSFNEWLEEALEEFHVLALPSAQVWPFRIECRYPDTIGNESMETYHQWMQVCAPVSFAGLPCVTIPAGFSSKGLLPMGLQLFGRRGSDGMLLRLANDYHQATKGFRPSVSYTQGENAVLSTP